MYLIGAPHPNNDIATAIIERLAAQGEKLVTDAEVFQEILHRYNAIGRREFIEPGFGLLRRIIDDVFPVDMATVERARSLLYATPGISSRDAVHLASMELHHVSSVVSFDAGFDRVRGIRRICS